MKNIILINAISLIGKAVHNKRNAVSGTVTEVYAKENSVNGIRIVTTCEPSRKPMDIFEFSENYITVEVIDGLLKFTDIDLFKEN